MKNGIEVYITKYALTKGIKKMIGEVFNDGKCVSCNSSIGSIVFHKNDWHYTEEDAIKRAEEMSVNKIKALNKAIEKLSNTNFNI